MEDAKQNENEPKMHDVLTIEELEIIELEKRPWPGDGGPLFPNWKCRPPQ